MIIALQVLQVLLAAPSPSAASPLAITTLAAAALATLAIATATTLAAATPAATALATTTPASRPSPASPSPDPFCRSAAVPPLPRRPARHPPASSPSHRLASMRVGCRPVRRYAAARGGGGRRPLPKITNH